MTKIANITFLLSVYNFTVSCCKFICLFKVFFLQELEDSFNYGLFQPPLNGRAGKFLDEERRLSEYPFQGSVGHLEVTYSLFNEVIWTLYLLLSCQKIHFFVVLLSLSSVLHFIQAFVRRVYGPIQAIFVVHAS